MVTAENLKYSRKNTNTSNIIDNKNIVLDKIKDSEETIKNNDSSTNIITEITNVMRKLSDELKKKGMLNLKEEVDGLINDIRTHGVGDISNELNSLIATIHQTKDDNLIKLINQMLDKILGTDTYNVNNVTDSNSNQHQKYYNNMNDKDQFNTHMYDNDSKDVEDKDKHYYNNMNDKDQFNTHMYDNDLKDTDSNIKNGETFKNMDDKNIQNNVSKTTLLNNKMYNGSSMYKHHMNNVVRSNNIPNNFPNNLYNNMPNNMYNNMPNNMYNNNINHKHLYTEDMYNKEYHHPHHEEMHHNHNNIDRNKYHNNKMYNSDMYNKEYHCDLYNNDKYCEKDRKDLMMNIMKYQLATLDSALFLDTHPNDPVALIKHNEYCTKLTQLKNAFTQKYGPLDIYSEDISGSWRYLEGPWPWEQNY